jgi:DNA-binding GntR family transcriptional regulator
VYPGRVNPPEVRQARIELPPSYPELVREMLEAQIIEGNLAAGERVSEHELAGRLGVSRTPVREAMRVLEGHGLIVRRRGKGTFVARLTTSAEAETLYELRAPLEGFLAGRAAENITEHERAALERLTTEFHDALPKGAEGLARVIELDSAFHWQIYGAAHSELISVVRSYWGRLMRELYARAYLSESPTQFAQHHDEIVAALAARDGRAARAAMERHVRSGWDVVAASFER